MATQKIRGLDDALKTLGKMDPVLRRAAVKRLKDDVKPIVSAIKAGIPKSPLSNWVAPKQSSARRGTVSAGRSASGTPNWEFGKAKSGVRSSVKKQGARQMKGKAILVSIRQANGAGVVFDMAGKATNNVFSRNLTNKWGAPSRRMWPIAEQQKPTVLRSIDRSVEDMEKQINRMLR